MSLPVLFILMVTMLPLHIGAKKTQAPENTFAKPDFAYPATVAGNADKMLKKAGISPTDKFKAALQFALARNSISRDNFTRIAATFDSLARISSTPFRQLYYSVEAGMYRQLYQQNRRIYDTRTLPSEDFPEDPTAWSRAMFAARVDSLTRLSLSDEEGLRNCPILDIHEIIEFREDESVFFPSVYDFLAIQAIDNTSLLQQDSGTIPFGASTAVGSGSFRRQIIREQIGYYEAEPAVAPLSYYLNLEALLLGGEKAYSYLMDYYRRFNDPVYSSLILFYAKGYLPSDSRTHTEYFRTVVAELDKNPDSYASKALEAYLDYASAKSITLSFAERILPGEEVNVKAIVRNMDKGNVLIIKRNKGFEKAYNALLKRKRYNPSTSDLLGLIRRSGKLISSHDVISSGEIPYSDTLSIVLPGLQPGEYMLIPSATSSLEGAIPNSLNASILSPLYVSNLQMLSSYIPTERASGRLYVVDASNQKPLEGMTVEMMRNNRADTSAVTGKEGFVIPVHDKFRATVRSKTDSISRDIYFGYYNPNNSDTIRASVLTDLSVYRPGDKVQFVCIAYDPSAPRIAANRKVTALLNDANGQKVSELALATDNYGRATGDFTLPESGLLGQFCIEVREGSNFIGSSYFSVAEYVAPKFFVELETPDAAFGKIGDNLTVKGKALTYSGIPVGNAKVTFNVTTFNWFWRWSAVPDGVYGGETTTGADGTFTISLPTEGLRGTQFEKSGFRMTATVTDSSGESQKSSPILFSFNNSTTIDCQLPDRVNAETHDGKIPVMAYNILGRPISATVEYVLTGGRDGREFASGSFSTPSLQLELKNLPSGKFILTLRDSLSSDTEVKKEFVVFRNSDSRPPITSALWIPDTEITASGSSAHVRVGSSYPDSYILCEATDSKGYIFRKWIEISEEITSVEVPIRDSKVRVVFTAMHDLQPENVSVDIIPKSAEDRLTMETRTFRDKLTPGANEKWEFIFKYGGHPASGIPVSGVMTNLALDAIQPFDWSLPSFSTIPSAIYSSMVIPRPGTNSFTGNIKRPRGAGYILPTPPSLYTYGFSSLLGGYGSGISIRGTRSYLSAGAVVNEAYMVDSATPMMAKTSMKQEAAVEEEVVSIDDADAGNTGTDAEQLRPVEMPLALFRPSLTTTAEGELSLSFTVPDFNTTWKLQLLGYTDKMQSLVTTLKAQASKPVMVSSNLPHFLRTGDNVRLAVNLSNNTSEQRIISGKVEITDPLSGKVLYEYSSPGYEVASLSTRTIYADFTVPGSEQMILVRAWAESEEFSDGEQQAISILPASSPVFDSTPFYIGAGKEDFAIRLPEFKQDASVTFQYSDNPVWYCITSLPDVMTNVSDNIFSLLYAYYGSMTSAGIVKKYPAIGEAISKWSASDSGVNTPLVSRLDTDASLKKFALGNTIWVNDAHSENLRMSRLSELLKPEVIKTTAEDFFNRLSKLMNADGGWSWCPGMQSSLFTTASVVRVLGMLRSTGYLPSDSKGDKMAVDAIAYCDKTYMEMYERDRKHFQPASMLDYLYARSSFGSGSRTIGFNTLKSKALADIRRQWRSLDIYESACAAILLHREGDKTTPGQILRSLQEKALHTKEKGMWYDNLSSSYSSYPVLLATSKVLQAFAEIDPQSESVDALRQWLLLQKQTQDWGSDRNTVEVVNSIISSGSDWTQDAPLPKITLGGEPLLPASRELSTGTFTLSLEPSKASGAELRICKYSAGPAWGGVMSQYILPMDDVKEVSIPDLSVSKNIYVLSDDETGSTATEAPVATGSKVRVVITVTNKADLDYLAISDERPAGLQPVEQLSGYTLSDGIYMYRENGKSATNFFIPYLPKGTHQISYDCYATLVGEYSCGIATVQSQYAPMVTAHSAGKIIRITE